MEYKNIVLPDYDHCILGTITSILKYYKVETSHKSSKALDEVLISSRRKTYKEINTLRFVQRRNGGPYYCFKISKLLTLLQVVIVRKLVFLVALW